MQQEIIEIDKQLGIFRVTTLDERYYAKTLKAKPEGISEYKFYPSSSWISSFYPKGVAFYKWLAQKGWDESEALKKEAGKKGSKTHYACADLVIGKKVEIDSEYKNTVTNQLEPLTVEEYTNVISFGNWVSETKPEILGIEKTFFNEKYGYAGTIDYILRIDGQIWIIDLKTSNYIWPSAELQIASYSHLDIKDIQVTEKEWDERKLAILQLGYPRNKKKFKLTPIEDQFDMFIHTKAIWAKENANASPKQMEYPLSLQVTLDEAKITGLKVKKNQFTK